MRARIQRMDDSNRRQRYVFSNEVSLDALKRQMNRLDTDNIWIKVHGKYTNLAHYGIGNRPEAAWQAYRTDRSELTRLISELQRDPTMRGNTANGVPQLLDNWTDATIEDIDAIFIGPSGQR